MSALGARLLSWAQSAEFYREFHARSIDAVGAPANAKWLDVGCGPGLLTRLAAARGYAAAGVDVSPDMIAAARSLSGRKESYAVGSIADLVSEGAQADVVSASSVLVVVPDPGSALERLARLVRPGGSLLIVEAGDGFTLRAGLSALRRGRIRGRLQFLVWLLVRAGRTVNEDHFRRPEMPFRRIDLLEGMVSAWVWTRPRRAVTG